MSEPRKISELIPKNNPVGADYYPIVDTEAVPPETKRVTIASVLALFNAGFDGNKTDLTISGSNTVYTINNNVVSNLKLATMPADTVKANITGTVGPAADVTKNAFRTWLGPGISQDPGSPSPISLIWAGTIINYNNIVSPPGPATTTLHIII